MYTINTIPHVKCFVRYLPTRCFCIRNLTRSLRSLVRFLIQKQLVCKYRTPALSMKYSLFISLSSAETSLYRREGWRVGKMFSVIAIFIGIRSGSLCEGERRYVVTPSLPLLPDRSQIKVSGNYKRVTSKDPEQRGGRWGRGCGRMLNSVSV